MSRYGLDATSKFEEEICEEAMGDERHVWEKMPKYYQKRAPVWLEKVKGYTSICRICAEKMKKGTIRFGTHAPSAYGWKCYYWHPYCYTAQVLKELAYAEELEIEHKYIDMEENEDD
jgi:hypothetical protein